jgi:hypothetical protein
LSTSLSFALIFEHFAAPNFLQHPFKDGWVSTGPLDVGAEQTLEMKAYAANGAQNLLGWVLLPSRINFEDGSVWSPKERGECFGVFWRDKDHPDLKVLPPEQFETNPD